MYFVISNCKQLFPDLHFFQFSCVPIVGMHGNQTSNHTLDSFGPKFLYSDLFINMYFWMDIK
jgi:hypothetical protein